MTNPTQHEKILAIAKDMYGEFKATYSDKGVISVKLNNGIDANWQEFNPYTSAEDSQAVQEFFKLPTNIVSNGNWEASTYNRWIASNNKDLKTAIVDCDYEVVK